MKKYNYDKILNIILNDYKKDFSFRLYKAQDKRSCCYIENKIIYYHIDNYLKPDAEGIFDLLHEIGHLKTNIPGMKRYEEELYATIWAINETKKYNLIIPISYQKAYQNYIYTWYNSAKKKKAKNLLPINQLILNW